MKTLLLTTVLALALGAATAQDKKCSCVKKTVHHSTHKATVRYAHKTKLTRINRYGHNFRGGIAGLGGSNRCMIDSNGEIQYAASNSYLGYRDKNAEFADCDINENLHPQFGDMIISSTAFTNGGSLPAKYSCRGSQVHPPLKITNIPPNTSSLALIMFDAMGTSHGSTTNWIMWNLDTTGQVPENMVTDYESENPLDKQYGYEGVCPQYGTHTYHIRVYALDTKLRLNKHTTKARFESAIQGHVLSKGELLCKYNKELE